MALSLFDHERRLHDLEVGFRALLDLLIIETPASRETIDQGIRDLGRPRAAGTVRRSGPGPRHIVRVHKLGSREFERRALKAREWRAYRPGFAEAASSAVQEEAERWR